MRYRTLDPKLIIETAERLEERIGERFPQAGLRGVAGELVGLSRDLAKAARADLLATGVPLVELHSLTRRLKPRLLRGSKFALDVAGLVGAVALAGHTYVLDIVLVPLAAAVTQQLVEWLGQQYVDNQREQARLRQMAMMSQYVSVPIAEWLAQWPTTGGSTFERLQLALRRIPEGLQQLKGMIHEALHEVPVAAQPVKV